MVYIIKYPSKRKVIERFLENAYETQQRQKEEQNRLSKLLEEIRNPQKRQEIERERVQQELIQKIDVSKLNLRLDEKIKQEIRELNEVAFKKLREGIDAEVLTLLTDDRGNPQKLTKVYKKI